MQKKRGGKRKKKIHSEMQENAIWAGGVCENPMGLSMYEGPMETVKYVWVNIEKLQECTLSAESRSTGEECVFQRVIA